MPLLIRPATITDADVIARYNIAIAWETEQKRLDETTIRAGVRAVFDDPHKGFYLVAEVDGWVVGQLMVTYEFSDWRNGNYWWIQSVYVHIDHRGQGVFRQLFDHVRTLAIANPEVIGMRLYAELENDKAHKVYGSLGMSVEPYKMFGIYPLPGRENAISE